MRKLDQEWRRLCDPNSGSTAERYESIMTLIGEIVVNTSEGVNPPGDDALNGAAERLIRVVDKVFDRRLPESAKGQPDDSAPEPGERFTTWWQALLRREASRQRQADWRATSYPICGTGKRHRYTAVDGRVPDTRACRELNELTEDLTRLIKTGAWCWGFADRDPAITRRSSRHSRPM